MSDPRIGTWPRALRLLIAVLRQDSQGLSQILPSMVSADWTSFAKLVIDRHRVAALVSQRLREFSEDAASDAVEIPSSVLQAISASAQANALQVLQQIATLRAIRDAFQAKGLPFAVLKGWPLSEDLFGNSNARQTRDMDILVDASVIDQASKVLIGLGFQPSPDHPERFRLLHTPALQGEFNNISMHDPTTGLCIELHWRCHQFRGWPELFADGTGFVTQETSIGPLTVPEPRSNLIYLAIHGSMHRWARLKWLCDIAAIASRRQEDQLQQDITFARSIQAEKPLILALGLSATLLGSPCPKTSLRRKSWLHQQCLIEIERAQAIPSSAAHRAKFYAMLLALSATAAQRIGVLRYRLWGKHRLALAALRNSG